MIVALLLVAFIVFCLAMAARGIADRRKYPRVRETFGDTCTKHQVVKPIPGGPDHLVWVYGVHRTQGNACDGAKHQRGSAWL